MFVCVCEAKDLPLQHTHSFCRNYTILFTALFTIHFRAWHMQFYFISFLCYFKYCLIKILIVECIVFLFIYNTAGGRKVKPVFVGWCVSIHVKVTACNNQLIFHMHSHSYFLAEMHLYFHLSSWATPELATMSRRHHSNSMIITIVISCNKRKQGF